MENPCELCGLAMPVHDEWTGLRCADCRGLSVTAATPTIRSALIYSYPVDRMIAAAKFRARLDYARELGEQLAREILSRTTTPPARLKRRKGKKAGTDPPHKARS